MGKRFFIIPVCSTLLFTSGCLPDTVQEDIEKAKKEEQAYEEVKKEQESPPEDVVISDEQKKVLEETEDVTAEEAVNKLIEEQESIDIKIPKEKDSYESPAELSQYLSNLFFLYHKGDLKAEIFYKRLKPHLSEHFLELLPKDEADRQETFEILQHTFLQYLPSEIGSYEITEPVIDDRIGEAAVFRKYVTVKSGPIYYAMILREEEGKWYLYDDSPTPPYEINQTLTDGFKTPGGE